MQPVSVYRAVVKSVNGRNIVVSAPQLEQCDLEVAPLLDGHIKSSVPAVDDLVLVIDLYSNAANRFYMPIARGFAELTADSADVQIETAGDVEIEGGVILLGADAVNWIALANLVNTELQRIFSELTTLKSLLITHTHQWLPGMQMKTGIDDTTLPGFTPTAPGDVSSSKTKSE